ncbi:MAG: PQQ-binding-like beta-propeller repeat protein [Terracidiphilus sp.]
MTEMRKVILVARNSPVAVATVGELGKFEIWNPDTGEQLTEFDSVYDSCGRLAISSNGERVIAANWRKGKKGGIACYDAASGSELWHRTDIGQIQHMEFSPKGDRVWCEVDCRPVHCLDSQSGSNLKILRAVNDVVESPYTDHTVLVKREDLVVETPLSRRTVPLLGWCRGVAFTPNAVCVSELMRTDNPNIHVGHIRCLDLKSGSERWHYRCPEACFIQLISYQDDCSVYCVQSGNDGHRWIVDLIRLTSQDGSCTSICRLTPPPPYFGGFGNGILVTPHGEVVSLLTGDILRILAFDDKPTDKAV